MSLHTLLPKRALLVGPPRCGKTSICYAASMDISRAIGRSEGSVYFVCRREKLNSCLPRPCLVGTGAEIALNGPDAEDIQIKYLESFSDIKWWLIHIHELLPAYPLPCCVVIDEVDEYFRPESLQRDAAAFMFQLRNAMEFVEAKRGCRCHLLLSLSSESSLSGDLRVSFEREFKQGAVDIRQLDSRRYSINGACVPLVLQHATLPGVGEHFRMNEGV